MFCVECGREEELIDSLCRECFSKKHVKASLPEHVDITLCAHCSAIETEDGWQDVGSVREAAQIAVEQALVLSKDAKMSDIAIQLTEKDERNLEAGVKVMLSVRGAAFERDLRTMLRIKRGSCKECSKQQGNYYEAILQVRGSGASLEKRLEREVEQRVRDRVQSMRRGSREVFLSRVERVKGGLDFYFSTASAARNVAREFQESMCAEYKESSSLWGRRDGREIYRMTFLVRFPGFGKGDVVRQGSDLYLVRGMSKGVIHGIDVSSGEDRPIKLRDLEGCSLVVPSVEIQRAVVLTESEKEMQILDPETMKPLDVRKPSGFRRKGDQIRFVRTNLGAFVLSDSW